MSKIASQKKDWLGLWITSIFYFFTKAVLGNLTVHFQKYFSLVQWKRRSRSARNPPSELLFYLRGPHFPRISSPERSKPLSKAKIEQFIILDQSIKRLSGRALFSAKMGWLYHNLPTWGVIEFPRLKAPTSAAHQQLSALPSLETFSRIFYINRIKFHRSGAYIEHISSPVPSKCWLTPRTRSPYYLAQFIKAFKENARLLK